MKLYYFSDLDKYVSYGNETIAVYSSYLERFINKPTCIPIESKDYVTIVDSILDSIYLEKSILNFQNLYTLSTFQFSLYFGGNNISFYNSAPKLGNDSILLDQNEKERLIKEVRNVIYR